MAINSVGGGSLDINNIVSQLMVAESRPFLAMQAKEKAYTAQLSAYGTLSGALGGFQTSVTALSDPTKFNAIGATSSDSAIVTASAAKGAVKGSYSVNVSQLSQSQTLTSAGQTSVTSQIGAGAATTLTFEFGKIAGGSLADGKYTGATFEQDASRSARTVTIDSSNNSLQGIRDAINKANVGVTATIISDGSAAPNRLVLTSTQTGETSSMKIGVAGDAGISDLLAYDPAGDPLGPTQNLTQNSVGQNAKLTINGVAVTSPSNNVSEAIQGVTLSALKIGTSTVNVTSDSSGVKTALNNFIKSYNELNTTIAGLTAPAPDLKPGAARSGGPLQGDATTRTLQSSLRKVFGEPVPGLNGSVTSLSQLGVSFQRDGSLKLDSTKLQKAIDNNLDDVTKLLSTAGSATDSLVTFVGSTSNSGVGSKELYISQLATKGSATGNGPASTTTITAGVNDQLSLTINGVTASATLLAGGYTAASLATHMQSIINGAIGANDASATSGTGVSVSQTGGIFSILSNKFGSVSKIEIGGSAASSLLGIPVIVDGLDVAGTIGGAPATGSGQNLTGNSGSSSSGIQVQVTGGAFPSERGSINISKGIGAQFNALIDSFLATGGSIPGKNKGLNNSLTDLAKQRDALNNRLAETEKRYRREFSALDVTLSSMQSTSNYLAQQLSAISNLK